jgi:methylaspartate mutase sigma subunit
MNNTRILLAVIGSDIHVVANRILETLCHEQGCQTHNLGALCSADEIYDAIVGKHPHLVLISTINGLGYYESKRLFEVITERGLDGPRPEFWVGGNLFVGDYSEHLSQKYTVLGFLRVYSRITSFDPFISDLRSFLARRPENNFQFAI